VATATVEGGKGLSRVREGAFSDSARRAGASIQLDRAFSDTLAYPDAASDRVLSSFMFYHLERRSEHQPEGP
jgi:hypothetical protein